MKSLCNEDEDLDVSIALLSKSFNNMIKRLNRSNKIGPISRYWGNVSTGIPTPRRTPLLMMETVKQIQEINPRNSSESNMNKKEFKVENVEASDTYRQNVKIHIRRKIRSSM